MRASEDIEHALGTYGDVIWRTCVLYFHSSFDTEDAYQETFLRYALASDQHFNSEEHRKAWLIRVATNVCKDMLKAFSRKKTILDESSLECQPAKSDPLAQPSSFASDVIDAMRSLDDPPRTPLFLALYVGYSAKEIASLVGAPVNTVYSWISRGKKQLKEALL